MERQTNKAYAQKEEEPSDSGDIFSDDNESEVEGIN